MMSIAAFFLLIAKLHPKCLKSYLKLFGLSILITLVSCSDSGFITPPTQPLGNVLNTRSSEQHPRFSYEGRYLVFASDRQGKRSVWLYEQINGGLLPLPGLNQLGSVQDQPDISADGRYIVYVSEQEGKQDIFVYDRQTSRADNITKNILGEVRHPSISGNGRFVAFESNRSGQWDIIIYDRGLNAPLSLPSQLNN